MKKIRIIALISALFMFATGYNFLKSQGNTISGTTKDTKMLNVVVAVEDIAPYTTLTSEMFTVKQTVANAFLTNYYSAISDVEGSISTSTIYSGEVLTSSRVNKDKNAVGLSAILADGKRAVTIEVDIEQGVANNIKVGNHVDVICVAQVETGEANGSKITAGMYFTQIFGAGQPRNTQVVEEIIGQTFSIIALQDIKIIALDNATFNIAADQNSGYGSVTLEVSPAEAAKIALLKETSIDLRLVLRPMEDSGTVNEPRDNILKKTE